MKKISIYTRDGKTASSSYYRIWQYFDEIEKDEDYNIKNRQFVPCLITKAQYNNVNKSVKAVIIKSLYHLCVYFSSICSFLADLFRKPDTIVILRGITPKTFCFPANILYKKVVKHCNNVIWDFDDNIFLMNDISCGEKDLLEKYSNHIIVTHGALRDLIKKEYREKVILLPTTDGDYRKIDINQMINQRLQSYEKEIRLIWLTSSSGLFDITLVEDELEKTAFTLKQQTGKQLILVVVCNKPFLHNYTNLKVENITWTRAAAIQEALKGHIGIMPLRDTEFAKGKGGFKIIQYMASGLPSIASSVGFNKSVIVDRKTGFLIKDYISQEEWTKAVLLLSENESMWEKMSLCSYDSWKNNYSYFKQLSIWKQIL